MEQSVECANCKRQMPVRNPVLRFVNYREVSMVLFTHGQVEECPHCHATYVGTIQGLTETGALNLQFVAVEPEKKIVSPTGTDVMAVESSKGAVSL